MVELIFAALLAFFVTAVSGKLIIPYLRKLKIGQSILEIGPKWHMGKQGTPTMGGIMFILGSGISVFLAGLPQMLQGDVRHILIFAFAAIFGWIGYIDDYAKVVKKRNKGLTVMQKLILQFTAAAVFLSFLRYLGDFTSNLYIPFIDYTIPVSWVPYLIFMLIFIVGFVNGANLTDGVDGLAACVTLPVLLMFAVIGALSQTTGAALVSASLSGALFGFLIYNYNPAKVFMGDTGSLFIGGAVCALAFAYDMPLILLIAGIVYVIEAASVIIQVLYFKLTNGKRVFKMAPLHHHYEMCGMSEKRICSVFAAVSALGCAIGFFSIISRLFM
ncbi:MAG: phospho-N-acetylmuramoyl-pentapeptide-transferase [Clostridiales bacterium]|nr:phospho-N-acetylmuramoyl-pentapeptide-transferase [Clostridiales bacterium]